MLKFLRYTLAALCLAASVGCLALWWRSMSIRDWAVGPTYFIPHAGLGLESYHGLGAVGFFDTNVNPLGNQSWERSSLTTDGYQMDFFYRVAEKGKFGFNNNLGLGSIHFPLWYASLVFVLAGVGILRLGQRFTIRSALIATTVVAVLLGMVVAL